MLNDTDTTPSSHLVTDPEVWNRTSNGIGRSSYLGKTYGTDDVPPCGADSDARSVRLSPRHGVDRGS